MRRIGTLALAAAALLLLSAQGEARPKRHSLSHKPVGSASVEEAPGRDFTPEIAQARKMLEGETAGAWTLAGEFHATVLLAVKRADGPIEIVRMTENGANDAGLIITWSRANGFNTPYEVTSSSGARYAVLALRRALKRSPQNEGIYTPYTASIDTPRMRQIGHDYLRSLLDTASRDLCGNRAISPDTAFVLSIIEHIDDDRSRTEPIEQLVGEVLVTIAANRGDAYRYSISHAGAFGLFQFWPPTYREIVNEYPCAHLNPDFEAGMRDHLNAARASLLLFSTNIDELAQHVPTGYARIMTDQTRLAEYLAAAYNSGPRRAIRFYVPHTVRHGKKTRMVRDPLPSETSYYLRKLHAVQKFLKAHLPW